ncbi:MAG: hypothetical protein ACR2K5_12820, partial [Pseudolabrys sp.]
MHGVTPKGAKKAKGKPAPKNSAEPASAHFSPTAYLTNPDYLARHKRFPTSDYLRRGAPRNIPHFSFESGDTGGGANIGIVPNWTVF